MLNVSVILDLYYIRNTNSAIRKQLEEFHKFLFSSLLAHLYLLLTFPKQITQYFHPHRNLYKL